VRLEVRIKTGARTDRALGIESDAAGQWRLKVQVRMQPEKGRANAAMLALIAKFIGVPKTSLTIVMGETDRNKSVFIGGRPDYIESKVAQYIEQFLPEDDDDDD